MPMARYKARTRPFRVHLREENPVNDKEDSGVHLEEPSSPVSKVPDDPGDGGRHSYVPRHGITITKITRPTSEYSSKRSTPTPTPIVRESLSTPDRRSRHNRQPDSLHTRQYDSLTGKMVTLDLVPSQKSPSAPRSSRTISDRCSHAGRKTTPEPQNLEEDEGLDIRGSNSDLCREDNSGESCSSENSDTEHVRFDLGGSVDSQKERLDAPSRKPDSKRRRFKKLIKTATLHRSQSVGCEKDLIPEHALFLQYDPAEVSHMDQRTDMVDGPKRAIHKTCSADAAMMAGEVLPVDPSDSVKNKQKSSIAKNVRKKFQKLRRRNTDSLLGAAILSVRGATKITPADAMEWGTSFESLLADKNGLELFRNFLKSEFSEENVEFWIACEEFKTTRTNKLVSKAQKIYSDYVALKAPRQVNLDSKTRLETVTNLENPTRDMFKQAQKRIQFLMENDSYKRFLDSDMYKRLLTPSPGVTR